MLYQPLCNVCSAYGIQCVTCISLCLSADSSVSRGKAVVYYDKHGGGGGLESRSADGARMIHAECLNYSASMAVLP